MVQEGGFSAAADRLGIAKSSVSKQIRALESRLGARLLDRNTRRIRLTDVGAVFYEQCTAVVAAAERAEQAVTQMQSTPRGRLRLTAPMSFGQRYLAAVVAAFLAAYPEVEIDFDLTDQTIDLLAQGYDLAIRIGVLEDSSMVAKKLTESRRLVVGAPAYFARRGVPRRPEELQHHDCLLYAYQRPANVWGFHGTEGDITVRVRGRLCSNNGDALAEAARQGLGLALLPDFLVADDVRAGRLEPALAAACQSLGGVYAVFPETRYLAPAVRAFVDMLAARLVDVYPHGPDRE